MVDTQRLVIIGTVGLAAVALIVGLSVGLTGGSDDEPETTTTDSMTTTAFTTNQETTTNFVPDTTTNFETTTNFVPDTTTEVSTTSTEIPPDPNPENREYVSCLAELDEKKNPEWTNDLVRSKIECERRNCHWNPSPNFDEYYCTFVSTSYTYDVLHTESNENSFKFTTYSTDPNENLYGTPYQNAKFTADLSQIINSDQVDFRLQILAGTTSLGISDSKKLTDSPDCVDSGSVSMCFDDQSAFQNVYWTRTSDPETRILDLSDNPMIIEEQYIQFTLKFSPDTKFFGLGEQVHPTFQRNKGEIVTVWASSPLVRPHLFYNPNIYGTHPFLAAVDAKNQSMGVFIETLDLVEFTFNQDSSITVRILPPPRSGLGNVEKINLRIFEGPSMLDVKKQFWSYQKQYVHDEHVFNSTTQSLEMPVSYKK